MPVHWSLRARQNAPELASELVAMAGAPRTRQQVLAQVSEVPSVPAPAARWRLQARVCGPESAPELAQAEARMQQQVPAQAQAPLD
ncbi:MAG: hypothetical protein JO055_05735 [Alphaproteobacteria bacterium]|nr:hypothetical protein [Alphaproteobacteria bacterium]